MLSVDCNQQISKTVHLNVTSLRIPIDHCEVGIYPYEPWEEYTWAIKCVYCFYGPSE